MTNLHTKTIDELYDLLTPENREEVNRLIELLLASQSDHQ